MTNEKAMVSGSSSNVENQPKSVRGWLRGYRDTIIWCVLLLALCLPYHAGFMLYFFAFIWGIYCLFNLLKSFKSQEHRKKSLASIASTLACFLFIWSAHQYYAHDSRSKGNEVAAQIILFHGKNGRYPSNMEELGLRSKGAGTFDLPHYLLDGGEPVLFYFDTFVPFASYRYKFETGMWSHED